MISALDFPPDTLDDAERSFCRNVRQHGWMLTSVQPEEGKEEGPGFAFTTGFALTADHPEFIIFSTADAVAHEMFWALYRRATSGRPLPVGKRTEEVFSNLPAYAFPVAPARYRDHLGWSRWFYRGDQFPCLQIVWPDRAGLFPWERGFDQGFAADQIDLTERGWIHHLAD